MTAPLRETLAKALYDNSTEIVSGDGARQAAAAVLRALATWEPSDAVVKAAIDACGMCNRMPITQAQYAELAVCAALRAMAEEGS